MGNLFYIPKKKLMRTMFIRWNVLAEMIQSVVFIQNFLEDNSLGIYTVSTKIYNIYIHALYIYNILASFPCGSLVFGGKRKAESLDKLVFTSTII